jgi:6-phosphogluconolactonase
MGAPLTAADHLVIAGRYCSPDDEGVLLLTFDPSEGVLSPVAGVSGIENPSWVQAHPSEPWLFAVAEVGDERGGGGVAALRVDLTPSPRITVVNRDDSGGGAPCHIAIHPSGRWIVVANYLSGTVGTFPVAAGGGLDGRSDHRTHEGKSVHPDRQQGPHAHSSLFSADGRFLMTADLGTDELVVYGFDSGTGQLKLTRKVSAGAGAGPRHMAFGSTEALLYVSNELDNSVSLYDRDRDTGSLDERLRESTLPIGDLVDNLPSEIVYTAATARCYVANRGHDTIASFAVHGDGTLDLLGHASSGGEWPRHFAVDPTGRWMLVAHEHSGWISVLPLEDGKPGIGPEVNRFELPGASCVQFTALADTARSSS